MNSMPNTMNMSVNKVEMMVPSSSSLVQQPLTLKSVIGEAEWDKFAKDMQKCVYWYRDFIYGCLILCLIFVTWCFCPMLAVIDPIFMLFVFFALSIGGLIAAGILFVMALQASNDASKKVHTIMQEMNQKYPSMTWTATSSGKKITVEYFVSGQSGYQQAPIGMTPVAQYGNSTSIAQTYQPPQMAQPQPPIVAPQMAQPQSSVKESLIPGNDFATKRNDIM
eukprot:TRINITY_DN8925_c0_g1_i1.p1 TRINITY_DN8925_c0_g1~~TRINITY_DN8925_c0_g1_i1.p1  ORF type:complete len:222 (+),score=40.86 TRINITY_DN8925_c0_g1_i1:48-713(+)